MVTTELMEARYGRKRRASGDRRLVLVLGSFLATTLVAFIVWSAFFQHTEIKGSVTQFKANDNHSVTVGFEVTNRGKKPARCQVSATSESDSSVGSREIDLAANQTSVAGIRIVTDQPASGAVVDSCWTR